MELAFDALVIVEKVRFSKAVEPLRILIIRADVVGEGVAPRPHLRCGHCQIERTFVTLEDRAQVFKVGSPFALRSQRRGTGRTPRRWDRHVVALHHLALRSVVHVMGAIAAKANHPAIANCLLAERYHHYETYPRVRTFLYLSRELLRSGLRSALLRRDETGGSLDAVRYAGEAWGWLRWQVGAVTLPARNGPVPRLEGVRS